MSSADPNEGDSTESFLDVDDECEDGHEQNPESRQEADSEKVPLQAEGDWEEEESWETVPDNDKDLKENKGPKNENEQQSPITEHKQNSDERDETQTEEEAKNFPEATNKEDQNEKRDLFSQEKDQPPRQPEEGQQGDEENQTKRCEESSNTEQTCDGDLEEETREHKGPPGTTTEPEPTKPLGEDGTQETTTEPEPTKPLGEDGTRETTTEPEPTKPLGEDGTRETTTESEPTKPMGEDGTQETTTEPTKPMGEDGTRETSSESRSTEPEEARETADEPEADNPTDEKVTQEVQPTEQETSEVKCEHPARESENERKHEDQEPEESKKDHCEENLILVQSAEPEQRAEPAQHIEVLRPEGTSCQCPAPAESPWTCHMDSAVILRMAGFGTASVPPLTVPEFFSQAVMKFGQQVAMCVHAGDGWEDITYLQYEKRCRMVARGILGLGLDRFSGVLILGRSCPQWFIAQIGAIMAGGVAVSVDSSCSASSCLGAALDSQAQVVMVQDGQQLQKILEVRESLSGLKAIVQWEGRVEESHLLIYTWEQLMDLGSEVEDSCLNQVVSQQRSNQCCAMVYEGAMEPRGVLLSHDNVTWTCWALAESMALGSEERVVSYLPPSHMTVQMFDLWLPLCCGGITYFTESADLKGSLLSTLKAARPTYFLGFPRLWEMVKRKWMLVERKATPLQKKILHWARGKGLQACSRPSPLPWGYSLAEQLIFRPARHALGLDLCVHCYAGTEPVAPDVADYYRSLGIELLELYGVNETSGVHSLTLQGRRCEELPGCRSCASPTGRWRVWGRNLFMGYLGKEEMTRAMMDEDGWFICGDQKRRPHADEGSQHRRGCGSGMEKMPRREDMDLYMEL